MALTKCKKCEKYMTPKNSPLGFKVHGTKEPMKVCEYCGWKVN